MAATLRAPPPTCPSFSLPSRAFPHLGPGSIHPDGGFIFVFVCLLIHASSYSGHRRGFRSTTECKSPRRLIHFHPSLVDIQLLSVCPPVSCSQDVSVSLGSTGSGVQWPGQPRPHFYPILHKWRAQKSVWLPTPPPLILVPHRDRSEVLVTLPFLLKWRLAGASLIELARTRVALVISLLDWNNSDESGGQSVFFISHFTLPLPICPLSLLQFLQPHIPQIKELSISEKFLASFLQSSLWRERTACGGWPCSLLCLRR